MGGVFLLGEELEEKKEKVTRFYTVGTPEPLGVPSGTLFTADNLAVMTRMPDECIDLIATDPPFNKGKSFIEKLNLPQGLEQAMLGDIERQTTIPEQAGFDDIFDLDSNENWKRRWVLRVREDYPELSAILRGMQGDSGMCGYLIWMARRLVEMRRILKPTGSIYIHLDHSSVHYMKVVMDAIFGRGNFRNDIVWKRTRATKSTNVNYARAHDTILYYAKSVKSPFVGATITPDESSLLPFRNDDNDGKGPYQTVALSNKTESGGYASAKVSTWRGITARWIHSEETRERWWQEVALSKPKIITGVRITCQN